MSLIKILALDKWARLMRIISMNGGPFKSLGKVWRFDTLKEGKLVGHDCFGNKFYENNRYILGRNRWVEYAPNFNWDYDATQITPEWYGWLHYKTDRTPGEDCAKICVQTCCWSTRWLMPHEENLTGTECAYYPYSTTRQHVYVWDGFSICNRPHCPM